MPGVAVLRADSHKSRGSRGPSAPTSVKSAVSRPSPRGVTVSARLLSIRIPIVRGSFTLYPAYTGSFPSVPGVAVPHPRDCD